MPTFDFISDMDNIFLESGFQETVSYTPSGGAATSIKAVIDREDNLKATAGGHNAPQQLRTYNFVLLVSKTDVPTLTLDEDTVTITEAGVSNTHVVSVLLYEDQGAYLLGLS